MGIKFFLALANSNWTIVAVSVVATVVQLL